MNATTEFDPGDELEGVERDLERLTAHEPAAGVARLPGGDRTGAAEPAELVGPGRAGGEDLDPGGAVCRLRTAMCDITTLWVPFASCGGPETTASSCAPALLRWYCCATCWAIELVTTDGRPRPGCQFDQDGGRAADLDRSREQDHEALTDGDQHRREPTVDEHEAARVTARLPQRHHPPPAAAPRVGCCEVRARLPAGGRLLAATGLARHWPALPRPRAEVVLLVPVLPSTRSRSSATTLPSSSRSRARRSSGRRAARTRSSP